MTATRAFLAQTSHLPAAQTCTTVKCKLSTELLDRLQGNTLCRQQRQGSLKLRNQKHKDVHSAGSVLTAADTLAEQSVMGWKERGACPT